MQQQGSFLSIIRQTGFRKLWINQILVQLAYHTLNFALIIWVFKISDTNLALSALMLAIYLPSILFGLFSGVIVDRTDRKKVILIIDLLLIAAFLLFVLIKENFFLLLVNTFFINALAHFFMPAESSSIPLLIPKKRLLVANALFSITLYASLMVGYSLGGPLLNNLGINYIFYIGAGLLAIASINAIGLPSMISTSVASKLKLATFISVAKKETTETLKFIHGNLNIASAIGLMSLAQAVIGMLPVILPSYMEHVLRIHATDSSYIVMLPLGLGMIFGALLVGQRFHSHPRRLVVVPAIIAVGILFIMIAIAPSAAKLLSEELPESLTRPRYFFRAPSLSSFFVLGSFLLGLATAAIVIPCQTVLQERAKNQNRGKIFAVLAVFMTSVAAIPIILAGFLSDRFGVTPIFLGLGIVALIIGIVAFRPATFLKEQQIPYRIREFLGLGHWQKIG